MATPLPLGPATQDPASIGPNPANIPLSAPTPMPQEPKVRVRSALVTAPLGKTAVPDHSDWLRSAMLKTRVAHRCCSPSLVAEACPDATICEQCENFAAAPEFAPALQAQIHDLAALRDDASSRGWTSETARQQRGIDSLGGHLPRLQNLS